MRQIKKQYLILISLIVCGLAFLFPFILSTPDDSFFSIISIALTAVGTVATFATLIIAILLYDRFGLDSRFVEKQTEKVLELADFLKDLQITVKDIRHRYIIRLNRERLNFLRTLPAYKLDCKKQILISPSDYDKSLKELISIGRSYWLPTVIKDKMDFIELFGFFRAVNPLTEVDYLRVDFGAVSEEDWSLPMPEMTFESFNNQFNDLANVVELWVKEHSDIEIDLKLEEPGNKYYSNLIVGKNIK